MKKVKLVLAGMMVMVLGMLIGTPVEAAILSAGRVEAQAGAREVVVPVTIEISTGENVSGLNFDLGYDGGKLTFKSVVIGPAAQGANKTLMSSQPNANMVRILVFGVNQTGMNSGVLASVTFDVAQSASSGETPLTIGNEAATTAEGVLLKMTVRNGGVVIKGTGPAAQCGNSVCEAGENTQNCPKDCVTTPSSHCGNGACEAGESVRSCPADCFVVPPPVPDPELNPRSGRDLKKEWRKEFKGKDQDYKRFSEKEKEAILKKLAEEDNGISDVMITPNGGTFNEPVEVKMSSAIPGAEIRYTTDGDRPGLKSREYKKPFVLNSSRTVKAMLFKDRKPVGKPATAVFEVRREHRGR